MIDFSQLSLPQTGAAPTDPIKIFESLPRVPGAPNDLWRGQAQALSEWHQARNAEDVLLSLNTGAGKTVVGLLLAKSLVNEGLQNVLYVCPTVDLVEQTAREAGKLGLQYTTRTGSEFSNDLFESQRTFCITTYAAVFNGLSAIRRKYFPDAIIFDDAHVAESAMRDAFTIQVHKADDSNLFNELVRLFEPHFAWIERAREFGDTVAGTAAAGSLMMVPPFLLTRVGEQLSALFDRFKVSDHNQFKWKYPHLRDRLDRCAIVFGKGRCEIAPPFLPSLALDVFDRPVRRVYLSATLVNKVDVIRAFGRKPTVVIEPNNDAGNGERLIVAGRNLANNDVSKELVSRLKAKTKVLIAVPTYRAAGKWDEIAVPPSADNFTNELSVFREASRGAFILVSRVDGIDLPHHTCRVMVLDGLPASGSLLERFQWEFLHMQGFFLTKMGSRLVQLFGRINRGRSDYGAFLIGGRDLNVWLNNDRFVALLPPLLQSQVLLGRQVQEQMSISDDDKVVELVERVVLADPRDSGWVNFYSKYIQAQQLEQDKVERAESASVVLEDAAFAEANFARAVWSGDIAAARQSLDASIENTARADEKLAGWHALWLGWCFEKEGDLESAALNYDRARQRLGLAVPRPPMGFVDSPSLAEDDIAPLVRRFATLVTLQSENSYGRELSALIRRMKELEGGTPNQVEEAVRSLGEILGFDATRPDNDTGAGPDVMWADQQSRRLISFELKTDKTIGSELTKKEIGQGHNHIQWVADNMNGYTGLGLFYVGAGLGCAANASPDEHMFLLELEVLRAIRERVISIISDIRAQVPLARRGQIERVASSGEFNLDKLAADFKGSPLKK